MFPTRLKHYNEVAKHVEISKDLSEISGNFSDKNKALYYDSLLEVNDNEKKLLSMVDEFDHLIKN